jgi:hypothetical protein
MKPASVAAQVKETVDLSRSLMNDILCLDDAVTNDRGEKPLLPVNFVSTPRGVVIDHDQIVTTDKDGNLKLKPSKHRPTPDKISFGQWTAANARILAKLIPRFSAQDLSDYLDYTHMIGDLLTQFTNSSVFSLDYDHRVQVNQSGKRWNDINCTLEVYTLKKRDDSGSSHVYTPSGVAGGGASSNAQLQSQPRKNMSRPRVGGGICWDYNSKEGCSYGDGCRYIHKDSAGQNQRAPRFQTGLQGKDTQG